ncbi:MAG: hypothetical protein KJ626_01715 [Verrucomicrobia bacterium]|nr:hypothetical protein [Verrucomicrobiota bacterium]
MSFKLVIFITMVTAAASVWALDQTVIHQVGSGTDESTSLTSGWIENDFAWSHTNIPVHGTVFSAEMSIDLADADTGTFSIYHENTNRMRIGVAVGNDNGGPGTWPVLGDPGSVDNTFNLPTETYSNIAARTLSLDGRDDGLMGWWGSNRSKLTVHVQPQRSRVLAQRLGRFDSEINSLTGGWIDTDLIWTHTVTGVAGGTIISAILEIDLLDADNAELKVVSSLGPVIGTATGPDNGGPGVWRRIGDTGDQDNRFVLPTECFENLADGAIKFAGENRGMGTWGANRSRLTVNVIPYATTTLVSQVGTGTNEAGSLTGGWIDTEFAWTNTIPALADGAILNAILEVDTLDVEPGSDAVLLANDGTTIGELSGVDNGGPGFWHPLRSTNDVDHFFPVPPSLFEKIESGVFGLRILPGAAGSWGANRARLTVQAFPAPADSIRVQTGTGTSEFTSLTVGWISGPFAWTNSYSPIHDSIAFAALEVDSIDADGAPLLLYSGEGVYLGSITSGDNGGPGTWRVLGTDGSEYRLIVLPPTTYHDLVDGTFVVRVEDSGGAGTYGMNRSVLTIVHKPTDAEITSFEPVSADSVRVTWKPEFGKMHRVLCSPSATQTFFGCSTWKADSTTNFIHSGPAKNDVLIYRIEHTP